jgi:hypothetical protein
MWMLNEQVDYISHLTESQRSLEVDANWQRTNATAQDESINDLEPPFLDSVTTLVRGVLPSTSTMDISLASKFPFPPNLVQDLYNFNIGFYIYLKTAATNTISLGYSYTDIATSQVVEVLSTKNVTLADRAKWLFISDTFDLPPDNTIASNVRIFIRVNVNQGEDQGGYDFYVNGLSLGQWSEEYNKISLGLTPNPMPIDIALPSQIKTLPAFPYGASGKQGYYLSKQFELSAKNFGVPLVFGSPNITKINSNVLNNINYPSLIFPGYGFLNKRGRYNEYTVEMWLRINSQTDSTRRIFGPIASTDGIYVDGSFLTLKIGKLSGSHFVGDWFRPMLIHIRVVNGSAMLVLNGEEVITLEIVQDFLDLPSELDINKKNQDWLGFYAYEDVDPIDIDTFSIYSYSIPTQIMKRRFVWGQAVVSPEQTNSAVNAVTAFNDYAFADYTANYNYPDFANWKQGFFSNVDAGNKSLSLPAYELPNFVLDFRNSEELFDDIKAITTNPLDSDDVLGKKYITLFPNSGWTSEREFIYFENFAVLSERVDTVYGVFKTNGAEVNKPLIKITNSTSNDSISILINGLTITYEKNIGGVSSILATKIINVNEKFAVGLDIKKLSSSQDSSVSRFFTNQSSLDMYVAGDGTKKFNGRIYKIGFNAPYNTRKISWMYDDQGIIKTNAQYTITNVQAENNTLKFTTSTDHNYLVGDSVSTLGIISNPLNELNLQDKEITAITNNTFTISSNATAQYISGGIVNDKANILHDHTANYTLAAISKYDLFFPDIAVSGYWEDYQPLSYFSKAIENFDEEQNYELDLIQYNQDFPLPPNAAASLSASTWEYGELAAEFSSPVILTYEDLNNEFYTGWENYFEMSQNSVRTSFYETRKSSLRSYISFQKVSDGSNRSLADFNSFAKPLTSGIIDPAAFNLDWEQTAFETTNGVVIYPPTKTSSNRDIDFEDYSIVYHLDFKSEGILHQPIRFKELQLASKVLERTRFTSVGSKFGVPVYYYTKRGIYFDLKGKNPISTYKKSAPYLYLDRNSGWKIRGDFDTRTDRGLAIPVNLSLAPNVEVSSIQMWLRFSEREFPLDPVTVFSIDHNDGVFDFYIQSDGSDKRGYIFAVNRETSEVIDGIEYYVNGQSVFKPFLVQDEWIVLGIEFNQLLDFSSTPSLSKVGLINLNGPLTYNNISYNLATNIEKSETLETRIWSSLPSTWAGYINGPLVPTPLPINGVLPTAPFDWQQIYLVDEKKTFIINPTAIYQNYTGSNRTVIDDNSSGILIDPDRIRVFSDISWSENLKIPV